MEHTSTHIWKLYYIQETYNTKIITFNPNTMLIVIITIRSRRRQKLLLGGGV